MSYIGIGSIKIVKMPRGEAPEYVRREWVGVEMKCLFTSSGDTIEAGVLTGELQPPAGMTYVVSQEEALNALKQGHWEASKWWRDHGFPRKCGFFSFDADEVEETCPVPSQEEFSNTLRMVFPRV